jgi:D-sedoheptulose 7-phosphate isomerase
MNDKQKAFLNAEYKNYPFLETIGDSLIQAYLLLERCFADKNKLLVCGNGGSAADADHIVGELMKGFRHKRPLSITDKNRLLEFENGEILAKNLQCALPTLSLSAHGSLFTAFGNDVDFKLVYAQQVLGYGSPGDILLAISTSGNSENIVYAATAAKAFGLKVITLTGEKPCKLDDLSDVTIHAPETETWKIQDFHGTIYHILCILIEMKFWED